MVIAPVLKKRFRSFDKEGVVEGDGSTGGKRKGRKKVVQTNDCCETGLGGSQGSL